MIYVGIYGLRGTAVAQWSRCCATNRKVAGSIPASVIGFFIDIKKNPSDRTMAVGSTQALTEMSTRSISWGGGGKGGRCVGLTTLPPSCAVVMKSGNLNFLELCGPLRGPGSSFGIGNDYGLNGPGSNPGGDKTFRSSRSALCPTQPPVKWVPGSFPGVKRGRGVLLTTHPLLLPRSWKSSAIPLPTLWTTPGLYRDYFTVTLEGSSYARCDQSCWSYLPCLQAVPFTNNLSSAYQCVVKNN